MRLNHARSKAAPERFDGATRETAWDLFREVENPPGVLGASLPRLFRTSKCLDQIRQGLEWSDQDRIHSPDQTKIQRSKLLLIGPWASEPDEQSKAFGKPTQRYGYRGTLVFLSLWCFYLKWVLSPRTTPSFFSRGQAGWKLGTSRRSNRSEPTRKSPFNEVPGLLILVPWTLLKLEDCTVLSRSWKNFSAQAVWILVFFFYFSSSRHWRQGDLWVFFMAGVPFSSGSTSAVDLWPPFICAVDLVISCVVLAPVLSRLVL